MKLSILPLCLLAAASLAAAGNPPPVASSTSPVNAPFVLEPFPMEAGRRLDMPAKDLQGLKSRGFGKTEILIFAAIAKASSKSWADLLKDRERGMTLRWMAKEAGVDYDLLFERSLALHREIDQALEKPAASTHTFK